MMKKETNFHLLHYLILIIILFFAIVLFFLLAGNAQYQFRLTVLTSFAYFLWGVIHHHLEGDLHPKIMVEYLLIAALAIILLKGAIYR